jgi:hypothetical protein
MSEAGPSEDATAWLRRSAAAGNNRAWELSVQSRSAAEDQEMLNAAHASAWHWGMMGTELNRMRATMLLKPGLERNTAALRDLLDAAYLDIGARLLGEPSSQ